MKIFFKTLGWLIGGGIIFSLCLGKQVNASQINLFAHRYCKADFLCYDRGFNNFERKSYDPQT